MSCCCTEKRANLLGLWTGRLLIMWLREIKNPVLWHIAVERPPQNKVEF